MPNLPFQHQYSLRNLNTFGLNEVAEQYLAVADLTTLQTWRNMYYTPGQPLLILGGGSNILLTGPVSGTVLHNCLLGRTVVAQAENQILWQLGAGEVWHSCVMEAVTNGWGGLENMALIPGTVGAAPMQNIGAYGVELKDVFHSLQALHLPTGELHSFHAEQCRFGYRTSVFKEELRGQYFIVSVTLSLTPAAHHHLKLDYGTVRQELGDRTPTIASVAKAVIHIRSTKLPNPAELGNAGSFFKNPVIPAPQAEALKAQHPDLPAYPAPDGHTKLAAAWLIEQCGWRGKRVGHTGAHAGQALVLVNYGGATGSEVWQLAQDIQASVQQRFGVQLEPEVNRV